jgi:tetratricopeptide (TPR) repeat protein
MTVLQNLIEAPTRVKKVPRTRAVEEARALLLAGRRTEAGEQADHAARLADAMPVGDRARAYVTLAGVFRELGAPARAKELLGRALELGLPHGAAAALEAARPLAELLEAEGDDAGALAVLKRATEPRR